MSVKEYRVKASDLLKGKYQQPIMVFLSYFVFVIAYGFLQDNLSGSHYMMVNGVITQVIDNQFVYWLFSAGEFLIMSALIYSFIRMTILIIDEVEFRFDEVLMSGFKNQFSKNIGTYILKNIYIFLWALLFVIPGFIKAYAYSMSFYLRNKEPDITSSEVITRSKELMKGHKWKLFILDLSYIGWYLLSILTFGILALWVVPRHFTARTLLFNEIYQDENIIKEEKPVNSQNDIFDIQDDIFDL